MIERIVFEIGGYFCGFKLVRIWTEEGKTYKAYRGNFNDLDNEYVSELQREEINELARKLSNLKVNSWKKEFVNPEVLDGTQWELEYKEQGKYCRHIYGSNDYPECWNDFIEAIGDVVPEVINEIIVK